MCQEGAVGTDPSMSDISYIDVKNRTHESANTCTLGIRTTTRCTDGRYM